MAVKLYRHFPAKQALFQAVTDARVTAMIESAAEPAEDPGAALLLEIVVSGLQSSRKP